MFYDFLFICGRIWREVGLEWGSGVGETEEKKILKQAFSSLLGWAGGISMGLLVLFITIKY